MLPPHPLYFCTWPLQPFCSSVHEFGRWQCQESQWCHLCHSAPPRTPSLSLHTNEEHRVQQHFPNSAWGKGAAKAKQEQGVVVLASPSSPQKSRNTQICAGSFGIWAVLSCIPVEFHCGGFWALQKMLPDPMNLQFQYWNCQSKGEERRAREVKH